MSNNILDRVLIVDDDPLIADILQTQVALSGIDSDTADGGAKALELFAEHNYKLVITDCSMPVMDGFQLADALRQRGFAGPIIGLTGSIVAASDRGTAMNLVLNKPLKLDDLNSMLKHWLPND